MLLIWTHHCNFSWVTAVIIIQAQDYHEKVKTVTSKKFIEYTTVCHKMKKNVNEF
jgi:hypothetical protein